MLHEQDPQTHHPEFSDQTAMRTAIAHLIETNSHPRKKNIGEGNAVLEVADGRKFLIKWSTQIAQPMLLQKPSNTMPLEIC